MPNAEFLARLRSTVWLPNPHSCVLLGLLLLLGFVGCGEGTAVGTDIDVPITIEASEVIQRPFSEHLELVGALEAEESVWMRAELEGVIQSVEFSEGQRVAAGDVLFVLRSEDQRADLREAKAELALATDIFERTQKLSNVNVSAMSEANQARSRVEIAQAGIDRATTDLQRTQIRAPFDGEVGSRRVSPGDRIDPDTELIRIDAVDTLKLAFSLPESAVSLARLGLEVRVVVAAFPKEDFVGVVYYVAPFLDTGSRRLELKALLPNADGRLKPGMFTQVELEVEKFELALLVPESAIVNEMDGTSVWRLGKDRRAERVAVELGPRDDGTVMVLSGLSAGDTIVTAGTHKVFEGTVLEVRAQAPAVATSR